MATEGSEPPIFRAEEGVFAVKGSRARLIALLTMSLLLLISVVVFGSWYAPAFGDAGLRLQHYLSEPLFSLGGLPITFFFLVKTSIFLVVLVLVSHFTMLVLQKRVLTHMPLAIGEQYAVARMISYLVFVLGLIVGLQSLGLNLSSLVVVGGALGLGVGLGLQAIVSNFVAGLILLLEQPIKLGDRIEVGNTYGDVVRLRGRSTWIRTNDNVVIIVPNSEFINQRVTNWTANDRQVRISLPVGVSYDSDPKVVRDVLITVAKSHPDVLPTPVPKLSLPSLERVLSTSSFGFGPFSKYRHPPGCRAIFISRSSRHFEERVLRCRFRNATFTLNRFLSLWRRRCVRGQEARPLSFRARGCGSRQSPRLENRIHFDLTNALFLKVGGSRVFLGRYRQMMIEAGAVGDSRARARADIEVNSEFDLAYIVMNGLSAVVACYGLFENSPAVVIGAMVIAMLLGPISGVALGLVDNNNNLLQKAFWTLAAGVGVVYGVAFILGVIHHELPLTDEIYSRTAPNFMDLMIALGGGAAGAYAMITPRLNVAFVGVAIATALVPTLAASAICLARGDYHLAFGALLLVFTNIVGIQVACSLVMWLGGYRSTSEKLRGSGLKKNLISVALLLILTVVLGTVLRGLVAKQIYEASVRRILETASRTHSGAYLTNVRFEQTAKTAIVVAVYRTPTPFTPEEVGSIEPRLPVPQGKTNLELRVRSVPVTIASKQGYQYPTEDLDDQGRSER